MQATVDPALLKAANLFVSKEDTRYYLCAPWVQRIKGRSIIMASDGHTMFVAEDTTGKNYPRRPVILHEKPSAFTPVNWPAVVRSCATDTKKRGTVWFNPKYIARVMKAAKILGVTSTAPSFASPLDPATFHLGENAVAIIMPMRGNDAKRMPDWLSDTVAEPAPKNPLAKPAKKAQPAKAKRARR